MFIASSGYIARFNDRQFWLSDTIRIFGSSVNKGQILPY